MLWNFKYGYATPFIRMNGSVRWCHFKVNTVFVILLIRLLIFCGIEN